MLAIGFLPESKLAPAMPGVPVKISVQINFEQKYIAALPIPPAHEFDLGKL